MVAAEAHLQAVQAASAEHQLLEKPVPRKVFGSGHKGGRPKKAPGAPKSRYRTPTGQQRLWMIQFISKAVQEPGNSKTKAVQAVAKRLKFSDDCVSQTYKDKDYRLEWCKKTGSGSQCENREW